MVMSHTCAPCPIHSFRSDSVLTEDTDSFIVGDRVWVNGVKPGYIQFIGETHFGDGDWAGVVLDDKEAGKNDGSVGGIRYFMCEPKRGVFARLHRLTRLPLTGPRSGDSLDGKLTTEIRSDGEVIRRSTSTTPDGKIKTTTTRISPVSGYGSGKSTPSYLLPARPQKVITVTETKIEAPPTTGYPGPLRIGDRVVVNSAKRGMLKGRVRFIGQTEFANGTWCGVELDEPHGKNDGSVAGRR